MNHNPNKVEKIVCAIAYIPGLFIIPLLYKSSSKFCQFHIVQSGVMVVFLFVVLFILAAVPTLGSLLFIFFFAISATSGVMAFNGHKWKIPLLGSVALNFNFFRTMENKIPNQNHIEANIRCPKCNEDIKAGAKVCKHCGSKQGIGPIQGCCIGLIALWLLSSIMAGIGTSGGTSSSSSSVDPDISNKIYAVACANFKVENSLKSPSTADFPWGVEAEALGNSKYGVDSYVDSQNGFGATIRTDFYCITEIQDGDEDAYICRTTCTFE